MKKQFVCNETKKGPNLIFVLCYRRFYEIPIVRSLQIEWKRLRNVSRKTDCFFRSKTRRQENGRTFLRNTRVFKHFCVSDRQPEKNSNFYSPFQCGRVKGKMERRRKSLVLLRSILVVPSPGQDLKLIPFGSRSPAKSANEFRNPYEKVIGNA